MSEEQRQQLWRIGSRAEGLLRQRHIPTSLQAFPLFQVLILPSFEPVVSWQVCKGNGQDNQNYLAVRSQWCEELDLEQLEQREALLPVKRKFLPPLEPTLEYQIAPLSADWCLGMMVKLQQIQIPLYNDGILRDASGQDWAVADGTSYELAFQSGGASARFQWGEDVVKSWRPLERFVREVLSETEGLEMKVLK